MTYDAAIFLLGLIAAGATIIALVNTSMWVQRRQIPREDEKHDAGNQKQGQTSDERYQTFWHAIAFHIHAIGEHLHTQSQEHRRQDSKRTSRENRMLIIVGLTAVFALGSDWIFYGQLREMREDRRPWVAIEDMKLLGPLVMTHGEADINIGFTLKNVGRSPATNTTILLYAYAGDNNPIVEENRACNQSVGDGIFGTMIGTWRVGSQDHGALIFPGETKDMSHMAPFKLPTNPPNLYGAIILGCVFYRFSPNGETHKTGFIWEIQNAGAHFDPKGSGNFTINGPVVPAEKLNFFKQNMGDFAD